MADPIISIKDGVIIYGEETGNPTRALDNVSLEIYPEEYIIFFGPSGCGKSTLLYTIAGLEKLTSGTLQVAGHDLTKLSVSESIDYHRRTIGMVFQAYYLISTLNNLQNITLPRVFSSVSKHDREVEAIELLKRFGIDKQSTKYPSQLSGGQQQRVSIARALVNKAPILLADEPVGNLDSKSADSVLEVFTELNKRDKKTIIMVTHNPNHLQFAHRVFYMKDGKIVREVRNKDREQIKEDTMKPFINHGLREFARAYPNLEEDKLKAKMVTSYLLGELDIETEQRLEALVDKYLKGNITLQEFEHIAAGPIRKNGIGLYATHTRHIAERLKYITELSNYMVEKFKRYPSSYQEYKGILDRVIHHLLEVTEITKAPELTERLESILKSRLEGSLDHDGFQELLDTPFNKGGAGLNIRTARNLARQLELLLMNFDEMRRGIGNEIVRPHLYGMKRRGRVTSAKKSEGDQNQINRKSAKSIATNSDAIHKKTLEQSISEIPKIPSMIHPQKIPLKTLDMVQRMDTEKSEQSISNVQIKKNENKKEDVETESTNINQSSSVKSSMPPEINRTPSAVFTRIPIPEFHKSTKINEESRIQKNTTNPPATEMPVLIFPGKLNIAHSERQKRDLVHR